MKNWLAVGALALAPHLADAGEGQATPSSEHITEEVDHPTSEKHAGKHDHRESFPVQTHVRIEVLGRIMDKKTAEGDHEIEIDQPRGFGELEVTLGKPGKSCEVAFAEEFEGEDLELETAGIKCEISGFNIGVGRGLSFHSILRTLNPNLGVGFIETREGEEEMLPLIDESLRFTGHLGRWSIMTGISEGGDNIDFSKPHLLMGVQYAHPQHFTLGVQAGIGREDQTLQAYGSVDVKGLEIAVDVLGQIEEGDLSLRTQAYADYSHAIKGDWVAEPYVRVASLSTFGGAEEPHHYEVQTGFKLKMPAGFAVFGAYEHAGNGTSANGGILGISYSGTVSGHHSNTPSSDSTQIDHHE